VCRQGEADWRDGRQGHPSKLREPILQWLKTYWQGSPASPSHEVALALQKQFGIRVSISHLNATRARLGLSTQSRQDRKKNAMWSQKEKLSGKKEQEDSCW
jgi:transposase